jgi:hypothetical protein
VGFSGFCAETQKKYCWLEDWKVDFQAHKTPNNMAQKTNEFVSFSRRFFFTFRPLSLILFENNNEENQAMTEERYDFRRKQTNKPMKPC